VPRERNYKAEYAARVRRYPNLPRRIVRGHGEVPARVAQAAEKGQLTENQRTRYREGLAAYERRYGPAKAGRPKAHYPRERRLREQFRTREQAEATAQGLGLSADYFRAEEGAGGWSLIILR
jgi:predicted ArsR family transcriptional regulator